MSDQCSRILARLQAGPATTWDLAVGLRIMSVTRRIYELRKHYTITSSERRENGKRVVTYKLEGQMRLIA